MPVKSTENGGSLVQGPYGVAGKTTNFEAVVLEFGGGQTNNMQLVHYWRDNSLTVQVWSPQPGQASDVVSNIAVSEGSLIYSSYGRLEVIFLEASAEIEGASVAHYARIGNKWQRQAFFPNLAVGPAAGRAPTGPPCFIQGTYGTPGQPGNFEALVPYGNVIMHWWRNNSADSPQWTPSVAVSTNAMGFASLIQSTLTPGDEIADVGNLEAIVLEKNGIVAHYERAGTGGWTPMGNVPVSGWEIQPGALIQSSYVPQPGAKGNFELLLLAVNDGPETLQLEHWWTPSEQLSWTRSAIINSGDTTLRAGALIQSTFGNAGDVGNFEAVVRQEINFVHWYRNNAPNNNQWQQKETISINAVWARS